jgi:hypothetical protein
MYALSLSILHLLCLRFDFRADLEELPASVVDFKREVYEEVAKEFAPMIKKLMAEGRLAKGPGPR